MENCPTCAKASLEKGVVNGEVVFICPHCTLWFYSSEVRGRLPSDEDWYTDPASVAPQYIRSCLETMKPTFQRQITELNNLVEERQVLDVGCGLGFFFKRCGLGGMGNKRI